MFSEEKLSSAGQKTTKYWNKIFLLKHIARSIKEKSCISKLSFYIFLKRKTRAEKSYAYHMLLSFKTSVTFLKKLFNFMPDNRVQ